MGRITKRIALDDYEDRLIEKEEAAKKLLKPLTAHQAQFIEYIKNYDITFGVGPAGTGKTFIAVGCALQALASLKCRRIILVRPIVEADEHLGFLPGTINEKVDPYFRPIFDSLHDLVGSEKTQMMITGREIEIAPLAYMRGRTLNDAFILLDEAQNTTREQMKMFLTRLGHNSKMIVTGDITQNDLPRGKMSGLTDALRIMKDISTIKVLEFDKHDVVRNPLVKEIVEAYELATQS